MTKDNNVKATSCPKRRLNEAVCSLSCLSFQRVMLYTCTTLHYTGLAPSVDHVGKLISSRSAEGRRPSWRVLCVVNYSKQQNS